MRLHFLFLQVVFLKGDNMDFLDYVSLSWQKRAVIQTKRFCASFGKGFLNFFRMIPIRLMQFFRAIGRQFEFAGETFRDGDAKMRVSYFIMGFSNLTRGQIVKGLLFLACEFLFILYMLLAGADRLIGLFTLGTQTQHFIIVEGQVPQLIAGDNSMLFLLYGALTAICTVVFVIIYFINLHSGKKVEDLQRDGKPIPSFKEELRLYADSKFHVTLLILPCVGVLLFTVLPVIFMILIAFTNYDANHQPPGNLFRWSGLFSFKGLMGTGGLLANTFWPILGWTLIWAVLSTISNYIFGMLLAMLINQKGIHFKGFFRTIFVLTIAIPQFVTLLVVSNMLDDHGPVNTMLLNLGLIKHFIPFLSQPMYARVMVLIVNLWIGMPYTMLITTGILMNIPADLYEAARMDGASKFMIFWKVTLPYMLFVTGPYLITQFIGNFNNFNIIYLLTGGGPNTVNYYQAGKTDLLVTWLYKLTVNTRDYCYASAIGIFVFIVSMVIALTMYHNSTSFKDEEAFQ